MSCGLLAGRISYTTAFDGAFACCDRSRGGSVTLGDVVFACCGPLRGGSVTLGRSCFRRELRTARGADQLRSKGDIPMLWTAGGRISYTQQQPTGTAGCGLLAGADQLHSASSSCSKPTCCGLLAGADQLHSSTFRSTRRMCCGLLAGADQLHSAGVLTSQPLSCGLLAGADQLHCRAASARRAASCGLLAGADQLHLSDMGNPQPRGAGRARGRVR